jgi:hypothetical protein
MLSVELTRVQLYKTAFLTAYADREGASMTADPLVDNIGIYWVSATIQGTKQ